MYSKYIKRLIDIIISLFAIIILSPLLILMTIFGTIIFKGNPFFFQKRPGKNEKLFSLIKFRTMNNSVDSDGKLLPDEIRLVPYGKFLRVTSLDELPEFFNILLGQLAIVGPRPLLVQDMIFMTSKQRRRHLVRQGLTGLAQINGRNNISWEQKLKFDLMYIENITFLCDLKIILFTIYKVFTMSDVVRIGTSSDINFGDYLLKTGRIDQVRYDEGCKEANKILSKYNI